jgi:hypothetical protein
MTSEQYDRQVLCKLRMITSGRNKGKVVELASCRFFTCYIKFKKDGKEYPIDKGNLRSLSYEEIIKFEESWEGI